MSSATEIKNPAAKVWDVVVIGGGPAGAAAAISLAKLGRQVVLLEKHSAVHFKLGESLPPASIGLVEHFLGPVGNADHPAISFSKTLGNCSAWTSEDADVSDFYTTTPGFGLCLDRVNFDKALRTKALAHGVCLKQGAQFKGCHRISPDSSSHQDQSAQWPNWRVDILSDSGLEQCCAKYLIDSSGRHSVLAKYLGVERQIHDDLFAYSQRFFSRQGDDNDSFTRLEAESQGWWYSNLLPSANETLNNGDREKTPQERVVVFHTDKDLPLAKQMASSSGLSARLAQTRHLNTLLKKYDYQPIGKIRGATAASERLTDFAGDAWLAIGDAAQAYDPLSSQGVYKALNSGNLAGQLIHYALTDFDESENYEKRTSALTANNPYIHRYQRLQEQQWQKYLTQHQFYYQSQQRWPDQEFWNRRRRHVNTNPATAYQSGRDAS